MKFRKVVLRLEALWWRNSTISSQADGHAKVWKCSSISGTDSIPISWLCSLTRGAHIPSCTQAKQRSIHHKVCHLFISFGSTKPSVSPWNGDRVSPWNAGELSHLDVTICLRFYWKKVVLWMPQCIWSEWQYSSTHFQSQKLTEVSSHTYQPQVERPQHPLSWRLRGPQNQSGHFGEEQNLLPPIRYCSMSPQLSSPLFKLQKQGRLWTVSAPGKREMDHFQIQLDSYHLT